MKFPCKLILGDPRWEDDERGMWSCVNEEHYKGYILVLMRNCQYSIKHVWVDGEPMPKEFEKYV
jgi:hypothetical protein